MALPVRKGYKGAPAKAVLTNSPADSDTSFVVDTVTGWSTTFPFYCVVAPGTSKEEKVKVTAASGVTLTVVRAQDDTSAPLVHSAGAAIYPVFTADEADEANLIASVMTTKGDIISTDGSTINRLGIGTNTHVLQADSTATNGFKWGQIVEAGIADSSVTSAKIVNNTIVDADINSSAAIALSKLATGALPTAITVASENLVDLTIVAGDIADGAVNKSKIGSGPRGIVAFAKTTTSDTTITATQEVQITSSTFTAVADRYYRITYYEPLIVTSTTAQSFVQGIINLTGVAGTQLESGTVQNPRTTGDFMNGSINVSVVTTLPAGSTVVVGILFSSAGTGQANRYSVQPAWICVEDIGTL